MHDKRLVYDKFREYYNRPFCTWDISDDVREKHRLEYDRLLRELPDIPENKERRFILQELLKDI